MIAISCAKVVPEIRVSAFLTNSDLIESDLNLFFNLFIF